MTLAVIFIFLSLPFVGSRNIVKSDNEEIYSKNALRYNSQNAPLLNAKSGPIGENGTGGTDEITTTNDGALMSTDNPGADKSVEKIAEASEQGISVYIVRPGDSLSEIADMFDVSVATIRGFNNIRKDSDLKPGIELLILPIDGISYKVQKGDTIESVAKKFSEKGDDISLVVSDIALFNDLPENNTLTVGEEIIIPNASADVLISGTPTATKPVTKPTTTPQKGGKSYFVKAWNGPMTQGFHDTYRAEDYGMPVGSKVGASAAGKVIFATEGGWGGGYGSFIIIQHGNGAQTLYAHLSKVLVRVGETVAQRQTIGLSGNTGRSTGPHMHFEIRHWGDIPF